MPPSKSKRSSTTTGTSRSGKRLKIGSAGTKINVDKVVVKQEDGFSPIAPPSNSSVATGGAAAGLSSAAHKKLKARFVALFSQPGNEKGVTNNSLKSTFGDAQYPHLVPIINELTKQSRLTMSKLGNELLYNLVSDEMASKFAGLDISARMVYQVIEKAGNMGIWTKDIRNQTNIQPLTLNKIFKALEGRNLIKSVKSVAAKSKKLYMLSHLRPAKELTGGPWYTELEFDHEFISEMRRFLMQCVCRMNRGQGVTLTEIRDKMIQAKVSRVELNLDDVQQLVQTLAFDHHVEQSSTLSAGGEPMFVAARRVTSMCDFKWWDALSPDFHFRDIVFEDGVKLAAHEAHHQTA